MRTTIILAIAATAGVAAAPASAQPTRREQARAPCTEAAPCREWRVASPWFYRGQDEGVRSRRGTRRLSLPS